MGNGERKQIYLSVHHDSITATLRDSKENKGSDRTKVYTSFPSSLLLGGTLIVPLFPPHSLFPSPSGDNSQVLLDLQERGGGDEREVCPCCKLVRKRDRKRRKQTSQFSFVSPRLIISSLSAFLCTAWVLQRRRRKTQLIVCLCTSGISRR